MRIAFFNNAKLEAEVLDGNLIDIRNLNSDRTANLAGSEPLIHGRLAIIFGDINDGDPVVADLNFDGPGDISRNAIDATK
ncbi:hypothetical protein [Mesorhizobium sp. B2-5-7]|uniref:hypothetical protein n=1 Tax=Mesorhizobium sp. B2-5-7 TaxID=2589923 RepID=UPI00112E6A14|nr:hypothetical protein [Mesorhizobium sp. B2-5-7]TPK17744.1 hypothetical protein FJ543_04345 [Mesorhizobium sp. B2-5-7]